MLRIDCDESGVPQIQPHVRVHWRHLERDDPGLDATRVLYAMQHRKSRRLLYLGKADFQTVAQRLKCRSKLGVWARIEEEVGYVASCTALLGEFEVAPGVRLTQQMLSDAESLLIMGEDPPGNRQCRKGRITRPGLCVACLGQWPGRARAYLDNDFDDEFFGNSRVNVWSSRWNR